MALDILTDQEDFDGIREVLGLSAVDVDDVMIQSRHFGWQAEYEVKQQITNWAGLLDDADSVNQVKLATEYWCAYLLADSFAQGGTVGNTDEARERNWHDFARQMEGMANRWLDQAKRYEQGRAFLTFMDRSEDIRGVREILGPAYRDLREDVILNLPFGGRAEQDIRNEITNWREQWSGASLVPAESITGWVGGTGTTVSAEAVLRPPGYGPPSVRLDVAALAPAAVSDSVHTLPAPMDLTGIDIDSLLTVWLDADPPPAALGVRLEFQSATDYADWDVQHPVSGFHKVELDYARPDRGSGAPNGTVVKMHILVTAGAAAYTGLVLVRDARIVEKRVVDAFRMAAQYGTAAYIAESYAANSQGNRAEATRWSDFAEQMRGYQRDMMGILDEGDSADSTTLYDLGGHTVVGRADQAGRSPWYGRYPPVWSWTPSPQTDN